MGKRESDKAIPTEDKIRRSAFITVICDVILIMALVACLLLYISRNNVNTYSQNVENITNIATAKSELMRIALDNSSYEIKSAYKYCNGKSVSEMLDYLSVISSSEDEFQLLKRDEYVSTDLYHVYTGYSTKKTDGSYQEVRYDDTSLSGSLYNNSGLNDGDISYSQSFTNSTDALRYFAVFCGITADENGDTQKYYLVKPQKESKILDQLLMYSQYTDLTTAICYTDGNRATAVSDLTIFTTTCTNTTIFPLTRETK